MLHSGFNVIVLWSILITVVADVAGTRKVKEREELGVRETKVECVERALLSSRF